MSKLKKITLILILLSGITSAADDFPAVDAALANLKANFERELAEAKQDCPTVLATPAPHPSRIYKNVSADPDPTELETDVQEILKILETVESRQELKRKIGSSIELKTVLRALVHHVNRRAGGASLRIRFAATALKWMSEAPTETSQYVVARWMDWAVRSDNFSAEENLVALVKNFGPRAEEVLERMGLWRAPTIRRYPSGTTEQSNFVLAAKSMNTSMRTLNLAGIKDTDLLFEMTMKALASTRVQNQITSLGSKVAANNYMTAEQKQSFVRDSLKEILRVQEQDVVSLFLRRTYARRYAVNDQDLKISEFFPQTPGLEIQLSKFNSLGDTLEHSELIREALHFGGSRARVIDFFSGSSLPTLRLLANQMVEPNLKIEAVDLDADAIEVSRQNARLLGVESNYDFHVGDAVEHLRSQAISTNTLVALNPPYIPLPPDIQNPMFSTINGGTDGTKFLVPFLEYPYEKGTLIAMTWSSLSNPARIIKMIYENFEVFRVQAYETEFGIYTSSPDILPYLIEQRQKGLAFFTDKPNGKRSYTIIGAVLRKK